jgi:HEAT repeat protein
MCNSLKVYSKSGAAAAGFCAAILGLERQLMPLIHDGGLRWTAAFALIQLITILAMSLVLLGRRTYNGLREGIFEQLRPALRERVLALAHAGEDWSSAIPKGGPALRVLEESIVGGLFTLKESGRDRVAQFAVDHGFSTRWAESLASPRTEDRKRAVALLGMVSPARAGALVAGALHDEQPSVRAEAARALLNTGDPLSVDRVFRFVLRENLLLRALLASELKRHARYLLANTIPEVLAQGSQLDIVRCLEIMVAWKRAMPSFDVQPWLAEPIDQPILPLALELLPYVAVDDSVEDRLLAALKSSDLEVQCAAARATGRLKIERLMPALAASLSKNKQFALAAATAMAQMGASAERIARRL